MSVYDFHAGDTPLIVSMPHDGTEVPGAIAQRMSAHARTVPDTDWHMHRLYGFARALGASILRPRFSRYVVDLNRPPDGEPLYPGASNTELCPLTCFDTSEIYLDEQRPGDEEVAERLATYWRPYHERLGEAIEEARARHGVALLFEAHSIRSVVPRFFDGRLPDFNLGTARGASCAPAIEARLTGILEAAAPGYSFAVNGRFTGGYITRHYGDPERGVHAVQMEQAQASYMDEDPPYRYREDLAAGSQPVLERLLRALLEAGARG